jgi:hypothetical protein
MTTDIPSFRMIIWSNFDLFLVCSGIPFLLLAYASQLCIIIEFFSQLLDFINDAMSTSVHAYYFLLLYYCVHLIRQGKLLPACLNLAFIGICYFILAMEVRNYKIHL